ncbi:hypothetical protein HOY82DRAFT_568150 [Tuber indicum]|nr:hypothetical protein HOY82DRAFT_568150 [Tuber indicum]
MNDETKTSLPCQTLYNNNVFYPSLFQFPCLASSNPCPVLYNKIVLAAYSFLKRTQRSTGKTKTKSEKCYRIYLYTVGSLLIQTFFGISFYHLPCTAFYLPQFTHLKDEQTPLHA